MLHKQEEETYRSKGLAASDYSKFRQVQRAAG